MFLGDDGKALLAREIGAFEAKTAAELVIVVEPRAGHYLHVPLAFASLTALATLAFLLYGEPSFALHWFLIDPVALGLLVGWLSSGWAPLERLVTPARRREAWALRAARAAFVARGVADTRGRTGVLLHISVGERAAVILPDIGVRNTIPAAAWTAATAPIVAAVARGETAAALPPHLAALADLCAQHLPRQHDDENELADEVDS
jgi:putative membrane protein